MMTLREIGHAVNSAIGAASETKQYMKEKRELKAAESGSTLHEDEKKHAKDDSSLDSDGQDWDLDDSEDEAQREGLENTSGNAEPMVISADIRYTPIPVPVVLPQRRPQARSRGYDPFQFHSFHVIIPNQT